MVDEPGQDTKPHDGLAHDAIEDVVRAEQHLEDLVAEDHGMVQTDRFGIVFVLILATVVGTALLSGNQASNVILLMLQSITLISVLRVSHVRPRTMLVGAAAILLALVGVTASILSGIDARGSSYSLVMIVLVAIAPVVIARRLLSHQRITIQTVYGALSIYLLIGLLFAVIYTTAQKYDAPFFTQTSTPAPSDFVYFSFVTITTTGYGDLTARSQFGHLLSVTEALLGQIYLVTVISVLVARLGKVRNVMPNRDSRRASAKDAVDDSSE